MSTTTALTTRTACPYEHTLANEELTGGDTRLVLTCAGPSVEPPVQLPVDPAAPSTGVILDTFLMRPSAEDQSDNIRLFVTMTMAAHDRAMLLGLLGEARTWMEDALAGPEIPTFKDIAGRIDVVLGKSGFDLDTALEALRAPADSV